MGGERETNVKQSAKSAGAITLGDLRIHESGGEVHFHDDKRKLKVAVPVADWHEALNDVVAFSIESGITDAIPPLLPAERELLEENVLADGVLAPFILWEEERILLDGHNRFEICTRHGLPYPEPKTISLPDFNAALAWVIRNQFGRRNLTPFQRAELALMLEPLIKGRSQQGKRSDLLQKSAKSDPPLDTRKEVAKAAGVSHDTIAKAKAIRDEAPENVKEQLRRGETTINAAYGVVKRERQVAEKRERLEKETRPPASGDAWQIVRGDCIVGLQGIEPGEIRLAFADPPYNIGIGYGDHYDDEQPPQQFFEWCQEWMSAVQSRLAPDGSLWILINHEWAARLAIFAVDKLGLHLRQWITWYESFGVNCTGKFNRCSRPILWITADPKRFVFHGDAVTRPSDRQAKYNDKRADPGGKLWDDVWGINPPIPRLVGTAAERIPGFPTQLPLALLRAVVGCASDPGDLVVDPFCGSATTGAAALELGRRFLGFELSDEFASLGRQRLAAIPKEKT